MIVDQFGDIHGLIISIDITVSLQKNSEGFLLPKFFIMKCPGLKPLSFFLFFLLIDFESKGQEGGKFFISVGYGLAGSFFVRSYDEFAPLPRYKTFYKKKFLGVAQNALIGLNVGNNWEIKAGINFQRFTRKIQSKDTLYNVTIILDHTIQHRNYIWFGAVNKKFYKKKNLFALGLGLYYLRPKQEVVCHPKQHPT